jgi:CheY-like chemotaxis protein
MTNLTDAKILVVEDNVINQKVLKLTLQKKGFNPDFAENGKVAVDMSAAQNYDLIFMDVHMPVMDGFEATRLIRSRELTSDHRTPIIALTASVSDEDIHLCEASGMDAHLTKPLHSDLVLDTISKWVNKASV